MAESAASPTSAAVVDVLSGLAEGELNSIVRFLEEGAPYLDRATAELRRPIEEMVQCNERHIRELMALIDELGGVPPRESAHPQEQYLAYLSFRFLAPKLIEAKRDVIERYENALTALGPAAPAEVNRLLRDHLEDHRRHLGLLQAAAGQVAQQD